MKWHAQRAANTGTAVHTNAPIVQEPARPGTASYQSGSDAVNVKGPDASVRNAVRLTPRSTAKRGLSSGGPLSRCLTPKWMTACAEGQHG